MKKHLLFISALSLSLSAVAQWTPQATGYATASRGVRNISVVDANTAWICAYDGSGGQANTQDFSRTTNGGTTWTPGTITVADPTNFNFSNLWAVNATTAWAAFYDASGATGGGVYKTTDGGATWAQQGAGSIYNNTGSFLNVVYFWDANNGMTMGDPAGPGTSFYEIYTTTDGGTTWTRTPTANIPGKLNASEYGIVNDYCVKGNTMWFGTNAGRMYKSTDKGLTWTVSVVSSNTSETVADVAFTSATDGVCIVTDQTGNFISAYRSTDGGTTWTALTTASGTFFTTGDIEAVPNSNILTSSGAAPTIALGTSFSIDGGLNWVTIDTAVQHTALGWADNSTGWTGGFNTDPTTEGISKYSGSALGVAALNNDNARMRMFPNPSNGQFTIQIAGAETEDARVKIVDLVGNTVLDNTLNNSSVVIERKIDLSNAAKGVYMVTVENGTTRFVNKIVIE